MTIMIPAWVDGVLVPVEKLEVHQRALRHKAVSVFVFRDDTVLLQQRAMEKYHTPGLWANTCCTHPEWEEDATVCATRRLEEELGITGQTVDFRQHVEYRADVGNGLVEHECVDIFVVDATDDMPLVPNPSEVMDVRWVTIHDLMAEMEMHPERFTPWLHIYLTDHAEAILAA